MDEEEFKKIKERASNISSEEFAELHKSLSPNQQKELALAIIRAHGLMAFEAAQKDAEERKNPKIFR